MKSYYKKHIKNPIFIAWVFNKILDSDLKKINTKNKSINKFDKSTQIFLVNIKTIRSTGFNKPSPSNNV